MPPPLIVYVCISLLSILIRLRLVVVYVYTSASRCRFADVYSTKGKGEFEGFDVAFDAASSSGGGEAYRADAVSATS